MSILGAAVSHIHYGAGCVVSLQDGYLRVRFEKDGAERLFIYPDVFSAFLTASEASAQQEAEAALAIRRAEKEQAQRQRMERLNHLQQQIREEKSIGHKAGRTPVKKK